MAETLGVTDANRSGGQRDHRRKARRRALIVSTGVVASATSAVALRARYRDWGASDDERVRRLPGDDLIFDADSSTTRAITISAPAPEVWRWLVQIGQNRGGWYSYEWLENLFGLDIHNADEIKPEWQRLADGDQVWVVPAGALGTNDGYAFRVATVEPGRALVLRQSPPEHPWDATWSFVLVDGGYGRCRLIVRSRAKRQNGLAGRLAWIGGELLDPVVLIMTRKMLLGIRARAEFANDQRRRLEAHRAPAHSAA